jgi:adenylyl- and sulfurtransferase ThiI
LPKSDFEEILLEAIDEGLSSLGESSKWAIYFHLEKNFKIEKQQIPQKIQDFAEALEEIFGVGANFLEILIMKRLYEKIGVTVEWPESKEFTFSEFLLMARRAFQKNQNFISTVTIESTEGEKVRV